MAVMNFGGTDENVVTREEFPLSKAKEVLKDDVIAVIGYGVQGPEQALQKGTIIMYLLSDAAQIEMWPTVKKHLTAGKALYFSHGFGITYKERTGIIPPKDVDVILTA